jgi:hypothetical protein
MRPKIHRRLEEWHAERIGERRSSRAAVIWKLRCPVYVEQTESLVIIGTDTHQADIRLGTAVLRIVGSPVIDQYGKRIGKVPIVRKVQGMRRP